MPGRLVNTPEDGAQRPERNAETEDQIGRQEALQAATGKLKAGVAGKRHRLISHNGKYIRQQRGTKVMTEADAKIIKTYLPYGL